MTQYPLISIIMPAYNSEKYITKAIDSVKGQTYQNWELIVIDDCSTDQTWEVIKETCDEKIRIYRNEINRGVAQTRNTGVDLAKGDWVAFLDSDDMWEQEKLKAQVDLLLIVERVEFVFTASRFISEKGEKMQYVLRVPQKITKNQLLKQNLISCSSVLVKKSLLQRFPFPNEKIIHEDFAVWLKILSEIPFAYGIDKPLLIYRISNQSKSRNKMKAAKMNWNTYRYVGFSAPLTFYYECFYAINGIMKYRNLK